MKLYYITQTANRGYDTYDSAVVAAESEDQARNMHPDGRVALDWKGENYGTWAFDPDQVTVELIGFAKPLSKVGVICASFNAG